MWARKNDKKPWRYNVDELGHNFRMMDVSAAMGISQLNKLDWILSKRKLISKIYNQELKGVKGLLIPPASGYCRHAYLYYVIRINPSEYGMTRDELAHHLQESGVMTSVHWDPPLHFHPLYKKYVHSNAYFPISERAAIQVISLPMHPFLSESDAHYVASVIKFKQG
jgi:dTDP-4-amino-4,6-dideoxygalactose transaminase